MAPDGSGGLFLVGHAKIGCDLGEGAVQEDAAFVARYGVQGEFRWAQLLRGNTLPWMNKVVADSQGNVILAGTLRSITNADWGSLVPSFDDAFLIKLNFDGGHIWSGALGSSQHNDAGQTVATWPTGEVLLGGYVTGYASLGGPTYFEHKGEKDAFLVKLAP